MGVFKFVGYALHYGLPTYLPTYAKVVTVVTEMTVVTVVSSKKNHDTSQ